MHKIKQFAVAAAMIGANLMSVTAAHAYTELTPTELWAAAGIGTPSAPTATIPAPLRPSLVIPPSLPASTTQVASSSISKVPAAAAYDVLETRHMRVTAYSSTPDQTDDSPFITASGMHVADGIAASNLFPFGTRIKIPALFGDKIFIIEDRMSLKIKNTIDIWMPARSKALFFGAHFTDIVVLKDADAENLSLK